MAVLARISALLGSYGPDDDELTVAELSRRTGLSTSTTSRLAQGLTEHGFLERSGHGFRLGLRLFEMGERAARPQHLRRLALANMSDLRSATRQTVHLAVLDGIDVVYLAILRSRSAPPMGSRVGGRLPAHATGVGKALLAWSDADLVDRVIANGLPRLGPGTLTDPAALRAELAGIRRSGISIETQESGVDVTCAACPILVRERAVAALSISTRVGSGDMHAFGLAVHTAASALSREAARSPHLLDVGWPAG